MIKLMIVLISSSVFLGLVAWGQGHHVPTWLYLSAAAPLGWVQIFGWGHKEESSAKKGIGVIYLFGAGTFLMFIGVLGLVMRGTWAEIISPALPFGAVIFVLALLLALFRQ